MAKQHSARFLALVEEARKRVPELSIEEVKAKLERGESFRLIDVREGEETAVVLYCGGGFRSALAGDNLKRMGYKKVWSMWGGWRAWSEAGFPSEK